jgi:hypothetical protein
MASTRFASYNACVLYQLAAPDSTLVQPTDITHTHNIPSAACETPPEDEQVMLETLNKECITLVSLY